MKILITGGGGFIGRNLAQMFRAEGHDVLAPSHSEMDLLKWDSFTQLLELHNYNFDAVIHTAVKGGKRGR